jgi:hypothetical protein
VNGYQTGAVFMRSNQRKIFFSWLPFAVWLFIQMSAMDGMAAGIKTLVLVNEAKISDLSTKFKKKSNVLEASGIVQSGNHYYVVFDDYPQIARIHDSLKKHWDNGFVCNNPSVTGYEGLAKGPHGHLYAIEEFLLDKTSGKGIGRLSLLGDCLKGVALPKNVSGGHGGRIPGQELHSPASLVKKKPSTSIPMSPIKIPGSLGMTINESKGFEGVAFLRRPVKGGQGEKYFLALCEGNGCSHKGTPYDGHILVYKLIEKSQQGGFELKYHAQISLTGKADFTDYSGLDVRDDLRMAVVSQEDGKLWLGRLNPDQWTVETTGVFSFPNETHNQGISNRIVCPGGNKPIAKGKNPSLPVYQNIEGISLGEGSRVVVVSDKGKANQSCLAACGGGKPCEKICQTLSQCKQQAIHVFQRP